MYATVSPRYFAAVLLFSVIATSHARLQIERRGGCGISTAFLCGEAINNSPWTMKWADFDQGASENMDRCQIYNWNNGGDSPNPDPQLKKCKQRDVPSGVHVGGYLNDGIDVDGICFADRDYTVEWMTGACSIPGQEPCNRVYNLTAGVWTKFSSANKMTCEDRGGKPYCWLTY